MEEIIFYLLTFLIGTVFGSFFTLAIYRIPLHQDITHERSYCPKCKHRLGFWDLIPVLSYLFLGGKCRYCKEKIRIRYLALEILTGMVFLLFAVSKNIRFDTIEISEFIYLFIAYLYIAGLFIIAGIDKEKRRIEKSVLLYSFFVQSIYMVYLCVLEKANIYRYAIYLSIVIVLLVIDNTYLRKKIKINYTVEVLELSMLMIMFTGEVTYVLTVILTLLTVALESIERNILTQKSKKDKISYFKNLSIGYYLIIGNIISFIITNFIKV